MISQAPALPKYVQNANKVLEVLAQQPEQKWTNTQRELGEMLDFSQPELSAILKTLRDAGKIQHGDPLPGIRGRNFVIEVVDDTPITSRVTRTKPAAPVQRHADDRPLTPEEELNTDMSLGEISIDQVGAAVVRIIRDSFEKEERFTAIRSEQSERMRKYRDQLHEERQMRIRMAEEKEALERRNKHLELETSKMREEINKLLMRASSRPSRSGGGYQMKDVLPDDSLRALESLMKGRPGHYRESDREVGVAS